MNVLVACEFSGVVRRAFAAKGHYAWSCDLLPSLDESLFHFEEDVTTRILKYRWDLVIAFPPCTYLASSGIHWNKKKPERQAQTEKAAEFFKMFTELDCKWAIENPVGVMSTLYRKPDQIVQPYEFGHNASKRTCLWLNDLPKLEPTGYVEPRLVDGKPRWDNQLDSGQDRSPDSLGRAQRRSITYEGIAEAMAEQWG